MSDEPGTRPGEVAARLRSQVRAAPSAPGVYRFRDAAGDVLYVGKAKDLRKRLASYVRGGAGEPAGRIAEMVARAREVETVVTASETEALLLEDSFIKTARPPFNLRLRDDKSYPFIEVALTDEWPRVRFTRARHTPGNLYFGPYASARKVRETLDVLGRIFPYRKCRGPRPGRRGGSPCLQYFIKRSLAPCDGRVGGDEYAAVIDQVVAFLRGNLGEVEGRIEEEMRVAATAQDFERAAALRDRLAAVRHVQERQTARTEGAGSFDVVGLAQEDPGANLQVFLVREGAVVDRRTFYVENATGREPVDVVEEFLLEYYGSGVAIPAQVMVPVDGEMAAVAGLLGERRGARVTVRRPLRGPKRRLLEMARRNAEEAAGAEAERVARRRERREAALVSLRDALGLDRLPLRIECFDISNLGERHAVGSMVVLQDGRPKRSHYRRFAVRGVPGQDDVAMIGEVVARRFARQGHDAAAAAAGEHDESFAARPDLVVVDGGKGQLAAAQAAVRAGGAEVPVVALAKQREEVFVPARRSPLALPADDPGSLLLQRARDEAHRFAVTFHRERRSRDLTASLLDGLAGVGPARRRLLLAHFGSPERLLVADCDELERVPGLPTRVAREIHAQLHKTG